MLLFADCVSGPGWAGQQAPGRTQKHMYAWHGVRYTVKPWPKVSGATVLVGSPSATASSTDNNLEAKPTWKEREERHDLEEHASHAPHVHLVVVVPVGEQALRGAVPSSTDVLGVGLLRVDAAAAAKVRELQAVVHDEDVLRLDVPAGCQRGSGQLSWGAAGEQLVSSWGAAGEEYRLQGGQSCLQGGCVATCTAETGDSKRLTGPPGFHPADMRMMGAKCRTVYEL
jgi:hypothetical protein